MGRNIINFAGFIINIGEKSIKSKFKFVKRIYDLSNHSPAQYPH